MTKDDECSRQPRGREHVGDKYVTYNRCKEGRHRYDFPLFPPTSEEEEEAQREAERRPEHEAERMLLILWTALGGMNLHCDL
jgi:hypothetical protein